MKVIGFKEAVELKRELVNVLGCYEGWPAVIKPEPTLDTRDDLPSK